MAVCTLCKNEKSADKFYKCKQKTNGLSSRCKECQKLVSKKYYSENKDYCKAKSKVYRAEKKEEIYEKQKEWVSKNKDKVKEIKSSWKKRNPEAVRAQARSDYWRNREKILARKSKSRSEDRTTDREYLRKRRAENPLQKITDAMGNRMRDALRGRKARAWRSIVGYSIDDLKRHLESQFAVGMSWENYGDWHIDHIRPVSSFDFSKNKYDVAKQCWALENLQPLWAVDNLRKGAKWDGD